ncbi:MAG: PKD domain-containing protein, partial [Lachnospiraceae bacterium]|nr:PKD domain-containing protein [Lachnospiraceae bacterium]
MRMIKGVKRFIVVIMTAVFLLNDIYIANAEELGNTEALTEQVTEEAATEEDMTEEDITEDLASTEEVFTAEATTETTIETTTEEEAGIIEEEATDEKDSNTSDAINDGLNIEAVDDELVAEPEYDDLTLTGSMTLTEDMTVNNLSITNNVTLDLNGYKLTVKGEYYQSKGTINFNNGQMYCSKNMSFGNAVVINMNNVNDYLSVEGNLTINSSYKKDISAGIVYLYGDFYASTAFNAKDYNTFVFAGDKKQTINLNSDSSFNILEFRNFSDEGIYIKYALKYNKLIDNDCKITYNDLGGERGFTLEEDTEIDGMYYLITDKLDLNGHTLTINGDLIQGGGDIYVNGGSLIINGDYRVAKLKKDVDKDGNITYTYSAGTGTLTMNNSEDYVYVLGSYINNLDNAKKNDFKLTNGTIELKGDIDTDLYVASGNHTIILSGEEKQTIRINKSTTYTPSYINNLILTNSSEESISFLNDVSINGNFTTNDVKTEGRIRITTTTTFDKNQYTGDVYIYDFNSSISDFTIYGDVYASSMKVNQNISIYGDVTGNSITLNGGSLYISGDSEGVSYYSDNSSSRIVIEKNLVLNNARIQSGELEVKGNLTVNGIASIYKLILSGDEKQNITNANNITLNTLELRNYSEEGIYSDYVMSNSTYISNGNFIHYDDHNWVHGWTLDKDEVYDGDLILCDGTLDLNGHSLTINGSLIQQTCDINFNHGNLTINGDYIAYKINDIDKQEYKYSDIELIMENNDDKMLVNGNFIWGSHLPNNINSGVIEIKGDILINQETTYNSKKYIRNNISAFSIKGDCTLILSGDTKQNIIIYDSYLYTNRLEFANTSEEGIDICEKYIYLPRFQVVKYYNDNDTYVSGVIGIYASTELADNTFSGSMCIIDGRTISDDLTVLGDVRIIYYIHPLIIDNATLNIYGDLYASGGGVHMQHANDRINVYGNYIHKVNPQDSKLTDGIMSVKGDCDFIGNYYTSENHKLVLNGDKLQNITFKEYISISILEIDNHSEEGVVASEPFEKGELITNGCRFRYDGVDGEIGWKLNGDEEYDGDLTIIDGTLDLNGHTLTVHGSLNQISGEVHLNGGHLIIDNDCNIMDISGTDGHALGNGILRMDNANDVLDIYGNFSFCSKYNSGYITDGCINLYGDMNLYFCSNFYSIEMSGNSTINFAGDTQQNIYRCTSNYGKVVLNNVNSNNTLPVNSDCVVYVLGKINTTDKVFNEPIYIKSFTEFKDNEYGGSIYIADNIYLSRDIIIRGDLHIVNASLRGGNIYCYGDLYVDKSTATSNNIILSGASVQNIIITSSGKLDTLTIDNTSDEGVNCESYIRTNSIVDNSENFNYKYQNGFKLEEDTVIDGDYYLGYGKLDLNGYKLTVNGNLIQADSVIDINGGTLEVNGNLEQRIGENNTDASLGSIIMDDVNDYMLVEGDLWLQYTNGKQYNSFNAGEIELRGDINSVPYTSATVATFQGNVRLTSDKEQRIKTYVTIANLIIGDNTEIYINASPTITNKLFCDGSNILSGYVCVSSLDVLQEGYYKGNIGLTQNSKLNQNVNIDGNLYIYQMIDLNGYEISAKNITANAEVYINNGRINCSNTFTVDSKGILKMINEGDYILVGGNMKFNSYMSHDTLLTAGTIELTGDFTQSYNDRFTASGTHKTILNNHYISSERYYIQTLKFYSANGRSIFNILILKADNENYVFSREIDKMAHEIVYDVPDEEPPVKPEVKAINITNSSITLEITAYDKDDVLCYEIYRDGSRIAKTSKDTYIDKELAYDTEYVYEVYSYDNSMNRSVDASKITACTLKDTQAPTVPQGISINKITGISAAFTWQESTDDRGVAGYDIYRDNEYIDTVIKTLYYDTGLETDRIYEYKIIAFDESGNKSDYSEIIRIEPRKPNIIRTYPEDLKKINKNNERLGVYFKNYGSEVSYKVNIEYYDLKRHSWNNVTDNEIKINTYNLETKYATVNWDTSKLDNTEYLVRYTITDEDGNQTSKKVTYYVDNVPPNKVDNVNILSDNGTIKLSWNISIAADCAGYKVLRCSDGDFECVGKIYDKYQNTFIDTNVEYDTFYEYCIVAYDEDENDSERSAAVKAKVTEDKSAPVINSAKPESCRINKIITISTTAYDNKELKSVIYEIKADDDTDWTYLAECEVNSNNTANYSLNTEKYIDGIYYVRMTAVDKSGNRSEDEYLRRYEIDNTGIGQIQIIKTTKSASYVQLEWKDVVENDCAYFAVEKFNNGRYERIGTVDNVLGYTVYGLKPNTNYIFRVVGYDNLGNRGIESKACSITTDKDNIAPVIISAGPSIKSYNSFLDLNVKARDNGAVAYASFYYSLDGENYKKITDVKSGKYNSYAELSYKFDIRDYPEGDIYIKFEAYDTSGNKSSLSDGSELIAKYTIDRTPPDKVKNARIMTTEGSVSLIWDIPEDDTAGFKIYRANLDDGNYSMICDNGSYINYYDYNITPGETYAYKIVPYDYAGNVNYNADIVIATVEKDSIKPEIKGVSPESKGIVGEKTYIKVAALDNALLDYIIMEYKSQNEYIWLTADKKNVSDSGNIYTLELSLKDMEEAEYDIRIKAVDKAGNASDYYECSYILDNEAPVIDVSAYSEGNVIKLEFVQENSDDISRYEIYRKEIGVNGASDGNYKKLGIVKTDSYIDETVEPFTYYQYKVIVYDNVENFADYYSDNIYATDEDLQAPTAVLPDRYSAIEAMELRLDGGECSDNKRIDSYEWDMGNGDIVYGSRPTYIYSEPGTYTVRLTVRDEAGNESYTESKVEVLSRKDTGSVNITITDTNGNILPYASIYINDNNKGACYKADCLGHLTLALKIGDYDVAAYKAGYIPKESRINISEFDTANLNIQLPSGDIVTGDFRISRMSLQEIIDAGVDISNPENINVFSFSVTSAYEEKPIIKNTVYIDNAGGVSTGGSTSYSGNYDGGSGVGASSQPLSESGYHGFSVISYPASTDSRVVNNDDRIIIYVSVSQSVSWLKDMFMVDLDIFNNADSKYYISDAAASINLPDGISLAATEKGQTRSYSLEDIYGQDMQTASWIVKADSPGSYEISADFNGILNPFNCPVSAHFVAEKTIDSDDYSGLIIDVMPERSVYPGEEAYIQFAITNNTDRQLYNFKSSLDKFIDPGVVYSRTIIDNAHDISDDDYMGGVTNYREKEVVVDGLNECGQTYVYRSGDIMSIPQLDIGESIYGTYKVDISGDSDKYYTYINSIVETVEGENLGVTVRISPISAHVYKDIVNIEKKHYYCGDPVDMSTGAYTDEYEVLSLNGKAKLPFTLSYNSLNFEKSGDMGYGWSHNFETRIDDKKGLIYYYTSPASYATFISEDSMNDIVYGREEGDKIYYSGEASDRDITYKSITPCMDGYTLTKKADGSYIMATPSDNIYEYDSDGLIVSITLANGEKCHITHNDSSISIEDDYNKLTLNYNNGLITSVTDNTGREAKFSYADGKLTQITCVTGDTLKYGYNSEGILDKAYNDADELYIENTYDEEGRVLTQTDSYGAVLTFSYEDSSTGMKVIATDVNGQSTVYESDAICNITSITEPNGYIQTNSYENGRLSLTTDSTGKSYNYMYDDEGRVTDLTTSAGETLHFAYDDNGNLTSFKGSDGAYIDMTYDGYNLTSMDRNGIKTTYGYNEAGLPDTVTAEGKGTASYTYDELNISTYTDALGHKTSYDYDSRGNLITITDAEGGVTRFSYDAADRITSITKPNGGSTKYTYDMYGAIASITDEVGNKTVYAYDTAGNIDGVTYPDGSSISYDYDINGRCTGITGTDGRKICYEYDILGNVTKITYPDGTSESYTYDVYGRKTSYTDLDGETVTYEYSTLGTID